MQASSAARQSPVLPAFLSPSLPPIVTAATVLPSQNGKNGKPRRVPALSLEKSRVSLSDAPSTSSSSLSSSGTGVGDAKAPVSTVVTSARQTAVAEVKGSPDWVSALSRSEALLQVQDLNIILRYFGESKRWQDVSQLFDWMEKHEKTNVASYSSFIKYMGKSRNLIKALQVYSNIEDESTKTNVSVCNSLLGCMLKNGKFESFIKLFNQMKDDGLIPDLITYTSIWHCES